MNAPQEADADRPDQPSTGPAGDSEVTASDRGGNGSRSAPEEITGVHVSAGQDVDTAVAAGQDDADQEFADASGGLPGGVPPHGRVHQPWRGLVVLAEVLIAGGLLAGAVWAWRHTVVTTVFPPEPPGGRAQRVTEFAGNWATAAIAMAVVAGFALVDGVRQAVLAIPNRR